MWLREEGWERKKRVGVDGRLEGSVGILDILYPKLWKMEVEY